MDSDVLVVKAFRQFPHDDRLARASRSAAAMAQLRACSHFRTVLGTIIISRERRLTR
ncbi:MAG: hypothetical protein JJU40_06030 [Rhodobacteraceae bacterium]|nr:hypothetical protein [Paracoccaceae bacterium]